jgi:hypothetical protein
MTIQRRTIHERQMKMDFFKIELNCQIEDFTKNENKKRLIL